ncbi:MAG TPA: formate dehydrogenase subunit delta [Tianweitania sediminis]|jgi:formate dehydrogenase subunit delta|nr:formate dehydrogenase subunit delta [Tianweitania sediminis]
MNTDQKLIYMANQIATFFASQPPADGPLGVATHINKFWEPRMRRKLFEHLDHGGDGLKPLVIEAAALIRRPGEDADAGVGIGDDAARGAPGGKGEAAGESKSEFSVPHHGNG